MRSPALRPLRGTAGQGGGLRISSLIRRGGVPSGAAAFIANRDGRHQSIIISEYYFFQRKLPTQLGDTFFLGLFTSISCAPPLWAFLPYAIKPRKISEKLRGNSPAVKQIIAGRACSQKNIFISIRILVGIRTRSPGQAIEVYL